MDESTIVSVSREALNVFTQVEVKWTKGIFSCKGGFIEDARPTGISEFLKATSSLSLMF